MKHGDKAKGKASKASGKKSDKASAASKSGKASLKTTGKASPKAHTQISPAKTLSKKDGNGAIRGRSTPDPSGFSNPVVGAAFKRAVKKYPNAFRRLTD